jgi:hypothetical protein
VLGISQMKPGGFAPPKCYPPQGADTNALVLLPNAELRGRVDRSRRILVTYAGGSAGCDALTRPAPNDEMILLAATRQRR